jgi:hypothetical protein
MIIIYQTCNLHPLCDSLMRPLYIRPTITTTSAAAVVFVSYVSLVRLAYLEIYIACNCENLGSVLSLARCLTFDSSLARRAYIVQTLVGGACRHACYALSDSIGLFYMFCIGKSTRECLSEGRPWPDRDGLFVLPRLPPALHGSACMLFGMSHLARVDLCLVPPCMYDAQNV